MKSWFLSCTTSRGEVGIGLLSLTLASGLPFHGVRWKCGNELVFHFLGKWSWQVSCYRSSLSGSWSRCVLQHHGGALTFVGSLGPGPCALGVLWRYLQGWRDPPGGGLAHVKVSHFSLPLQLMKRGALRVLYKCTLYVLRVDSNGIWDPRWWAQL